MSYRKVSILIPVYNEEETIQEIITSVINSDTLGLKKEIIVVDDGSSDKTRKILSKLKHKNLSVFKHKINKGKGAAIRTGIKNTTGDIILIQDADLEYHPKDYPKILKPFLKNKAKVVYGSRELSGKNVHSSAIFHAGGRLVTYITNLFFGSNLTDEATGYKVFDGNLLKEIPLKCNGFEFCPEVTGHVLKKGVKIFEVPIKYSARHRGEGKKIKAKDGVEAILTLLRVRFL